MKNVVKVLVVLETDCTTLNGVTHFLKKILPEGAKIIFTRWIHNEQSTEDENLPYV